MKKLALAALAIICSLAFTGCFGKDSKIIVGYAQIGAEADWRVANTNSFNETFTEEKGYEFIFVNAQQKQENQIEAIRTFIEEGVDYIVLAPVVETGWDTVLLEAKEADIPVILSDRLVKVNDDNLYTCWVGGNFLKEARDGVAWLESYIKEIGRENEMINIVDIQGTLGASAQIGRTQGIVEGIDSHRNWRLVAQQSGDFNQEGGERVMAEMLKSVTRIDVVFAENDNMAWGAIDAIKATNLVPGKDIIIISFDAVRESFIRILAGEMNCAVECNPLHGPRVEEIILKLRAGEIVEKIQYVNEGVFDIKNAAEMLPTRKY